MKQRIKDKLSNLIVALFSKLNNGKVIGVIVDTPKITEFPYEIIEYKLQYKLTMEQQRELALSDLKEDEITNGFKNQLLKDVEKAVEMFIIENHNGTGNTLIALRLIVAKPKK